RRLEETVDQAEPKQAQRRQREQSAGGKKTPSQHRHAHAPGKGRPERPPLVMGWEKGDRLPARDGNSKAPGNREQLPYRRRACKEEAQPIVHNNLPGKELFVSERYSNTAHEGAALYNLHDGLNARRRTREETPGKSPQA